MDFLTGKKTYIAAAVGLVWTWSGVYLGKTSIDDAINASGQYVLAATIRKGITDQSKS